MTVLRTGTDENETHYLHECIILIDALVRYTRNSLVSTNKQLMPI